jgi:glycosyltransferase involved in cell wall biosynthesis
MDSVRITVIIPTYNNNRSVAQVVSDVKNYCGEIIVVDDGSTDGSSETLRGIKGIDVITFAANRGKGAALRAGFERAYAKGFTHAITVDADGQHLAKDIPLFISAINTSQETVWVGDRKVPIDEGTAQPVRSRFGRRFGAFWYRFYTGLSIRDTQCGFRAYPLARTIPLHCKGDRYEFEIDVLIKAAWEKVPVESVPVHLYYQEPGVSVSHFRPVRDFMRISGVNAKAAMTRIFLPLRFIDAPGKTVREKLGSLVKRELGANASPPRAAFSLAFGIFMAIFPIHGFQVLVLLACAFMFRLNRPLALLGVSISSPPFLPFWIAATVGTGRALFDGAMSNSLRSWCGRALPHWVSADLLSSHPLIVNGVFDFFLGSIVLAFVLGFLTFIIAYPLFRAMAGKKNRD